MTRVTKPPLNYFGGKQYLVPALLGLLPPHEVYVETHGGSAALLFAKRPAHLEVYNDLDSGLVNFYRVLRDAKRAKELRRLLTLTPYSREEWVECRLTWRQADTDVEMARRFFVSLIQSFSKTPSSQGWSYCRQPNGHAVSKFRGLIDHIPAAVERLSRVQVDHVDALDALARYDAPNTLFYVDPPYMPSTRKSGGYNHEMSVDDHKRLLTALLDLRGMVILSGYRCDLYDDALAGWTRRDVSTVNWSSNTAREKRIECIWLSPHVTQHQPQLWQMFNTDEVTA